MSHKPLPPASDFIDKLKAQQQEANNMASQLIKFLDTFRPNDKIQTAQRRIAEGILWADAFFDSMINVAKPIDPEEPPASSTINNGESNVQ